MLLQVLEPEKCGVVAPAVIGPAGGVEDSVRYFPAPSSLRAEPDHFVEAGR